MVVYSCGRPTAPCSAICDSIQRCSKFDTPRHCLHTTLKHQHLTLQVKKIHEEEWSFIPVGGPLPVAQQSVTAFGAAEDVLKVPATGAHYMEASAPDSAGEEDP